MSTFLFERNHSGCHQSFRFDRGFRIILTVLLTLTPLLVSTHVLADGPAVGKSHTPPWADGAGFDLDADPAIPYFAQLGLLEWLDDPSSVPNVDLDAYHTLDHFIPLGDGRAIHAIETFTLRAWLKFWPRGVLLLNGSAFVANHWSIPVQGYHGAQILADEKYHVFAVDFLGTGQSSRPPHGQDAEYEDNREAMKTVLRYIRFFRGVHRVDLIGAGYGGAMGMELARDRRRVRSVATSAMIYREVQGGPLTDPGFIAFLQSLPSGYAPLQGNGSFIFMAGAPQAARDFVAVTQGGLFPVDNFLVAAQRPFFDPKVGRAPALILYGGLDFIAVRSDIEQLAEDYGRYGASARFKVNEAAGHAPRTGSPEEAAWYWRKIVDFLRFPWAG
ncbi:MAG: dienelactone hydrolase family protein [Thermoanaerobaculia bacterium]|nr:dienelactone hydrolase family protein [Thermoanaerobaculia bacterium]